MPGYSNAFVSYQTEDRAVAGSLRDALTPAGITAFLAHEDIDVSVEWRGRLLQELHRADVFIAVLSAAYLRSHWCIQESGIAAYKPDLLVIPLSLDGTIPPAFLGGFQSARLVPASLSPATLAPAYTSKEPAKGLYNLITIVENSINYRDAEANFAFIMPHVVAMGPEHAAALIEATASNDQVSNAAKCVREYIPTILRGFPLAGSPEARAKLTATCGRYGVQL